MHRFNFLWASMLCIGLTSTAFAQDASSESLVQESETATQKTENTEAVTTAENSTIDSKHPRFDALKELKYVKVENLKVNANAAQADDVKDPLQPLNREIFAFNDMLDRNVARPLAVQYSEKVPEDVRGSYSSFRKNLSEPWNAVNQLAQGRFSRAAKTLGRFTINTVTSLGFADPAKRLGMPNEDESLGTTLGYYGVPSGPYLMLPLFGPSTLRNSLDYVAESYANPLTYTVDNADQSGYIWGNRLMGGINARSRLLEFEGALQGDRYAAIRDIYLQRQSYNIAKKKGLDTEAISFVDDVDEDTSTDAEQ
ncbi:MULTISPECIES: VacJ family lipoprotein [unclassified Acinetobacter]|uniref:MlaA family lipoprotein n=1 Tax=unclassified Acinetobacter TaxID=196816 RepID=UPI002578DB68|nr:MULTISPECIES: VacJ family lipoprotein [unclassified Acinetobacter]MDM1756998.1 VacJ family lipoprotein [Acinetobacter sp. 256-1]MDM1759789.1 VacJ family lipoprotein [Acinetobacter sp. 251-1]